MAFGRNLADFLKYVFIFLGPVGKFLFKAVVLPLYGRYLWLKSKLAKASPKKGDRWLVLITNRYLTHIIILILVSGVTVSNVMAYESKEDYGQNALIYRLSGLSQGEIIEDSNMIADESKIYDYQDQGTFVEGNSFAVGDNSDSDNVFTDSATTMGDLAIIKPDILDTGNIKSTVGKINEYVVIDGDTISSIARRFGVSVNTILWANNMSFSSYVKPGQKLRVPSISGVIHTIARGDTLASIAKKYAINLAAIQEANGLTTEGLTVGTSLIVPGGKIIETAKPRTVATYVNQTPKTSGSAPSDNAVVTGTGKMAWPSSCRYISQYYKGWLHTGVDIACPWGTPLKAADGGKVTRVQYGKTGYGYNVIIDHGGGVQTLYGHMSSIDVVAGQYVDKGEVIGKEGSTGRSTGPHIHFEVRINGSMVNPLGYIR